MSTRPPNRSATDSDDEALTAQQMQQAEELLFSEPARRDSPRPCFAASSGRRFFSPIPSCPHRNGRPSRDAVAAVRVFTKSHIDPAAIDREADIPRSVIDGLAELGVLGMTAPGAWRAGVLAARLLPDHGGDRRPLSRRPRSSSTPITRSASAHWSSSARPSRRRDGFPHSPAARSWRRSRSPRNRPAPTPRTCRRPRPPAATARRTCSTAPSDTSPTERSPTC